MLRRFLCLVAFASSLLVLTACGHKASRVAIQPPKAPVMPSTTTTTVRKPDLGDWLAHLKWETAAAGVKQGGKSSQGVIKSRPSAAPAARIEIGTAISATLACIKQHESGDYGEHSHLRDGSGAYQAIPRTWQTISAGAGYPGYEYEYLAPPAVQDAVVAWALTHGYAGAWSMNFGNDPCTQGM